MANDFLTLGLSTPRRAAARTPEEYKAETGSLLHLNDSPKKKPVEWESPWLIGLELLLYYFVHHDGNPSCDS